MKMVKEEILAGLKYAIAKGEPLAEAMMSFYNAGYLKKDVEEAARALQISQLPQTQPLQQPTQPVKQPLQQQVQLKQIPRAPVRVIQRVSEYKERPKILGKAIIIMLVLFLVFLLGILVTVFLFREELANFIGNIL